LPIEWKEADDGELLITASCPAEDFVKAQALDAQHEWLAKYLKAFTRTLGPRLRSIENEIAGRYPSISARLEPVPRPPDHVVSDDADSVRDQGRQVRKEIADHLAAADALSAATARLIAASGTLRKSSLRQRTRCPSACARPSALFLDFLDTASGTGGSGRSS